MSKEQDDIHDEYFGRKAIPVLPPMIGNRTYFNKAADRIKAINEGRATDPLPSNFYYLSRTHEKLKGSPGFVSRFHWKGGPCNSEALSDDEKGRIIDGSVFDALRIREKCHLCRSARMRDKESR